MFARKKKTPQFTDLAKLSPFTNLKEDQLILLASKAELRTLKKGARLLKLKDNNLFDFFILDGCVNCKDKNGHSFTILGGSVEAKNPIAKIRPSLYEVVTTEPSTLISIEKRFIETLLKEEEKAPIRLDDKIKKADSGGRKIFLKIYEDLANNTLTLPSISSVAFKVRKLIDSGQSGTKEISDVINIDPAMAAKIMKAVNSPLYRGASKIETINQAVVRLGSTVTRQLVLSFAMRDVFKVDNAKLKATMKAVWEHSLEIAAICFVLSKELKILSSEEALLAGLLHDIGAIPIVLYAEKFPNLLDSEQALTTTIDAFKGELGGIILKKWDFSHPIVTAAREAEAWSRQSDQQDYCDLVIVAQMHTYAEQPLLDNAPTLQQSPAFTRLGLNKLAPEALAQILDKAKLQRDTIKSLFSNG